MPRPLQIGLFSPSHVDSIPLILEGIRAVNPDWAVTPVMPMPSDPPLERYVAQVVGMGFDALICDADFDMWRFFSTRPERLVWFFGWNEPPWGSSVRIREEQVGRTGARFLLDQGFEQLAFLGAEPVWSLRRQRGFVAEAAEAGATCSVSYPDGPQPGQPDWKTIFTQEYLTRWLTSLPKPVAVMACAANTAAALVLAARSLDLRIPVDVAVLAAEDTRMICENTWPGISGVDLGLKRLGTRLAGLLQRRLEGETTDVHVQLDPAGVVARPSTEFAAADDDVLAAALAYLHETPLDEACLEEMYRRVPASARTIQRRFAQRLGCSPADHLQRMRLGQAQHLLRATSLPLVDIAVRCGYEFVSNFCRSFKSATGRTPTQYRRGLDPGAG